MTTLAHLHYGSDYPFEYEMVRFLSGKQRELAIMK